MKQIILIGIIFCSISVSQAQNCMTDFIKNMEQAYGKSKKKHHRITQKAIKRAEYTKLLVNDNLTIINIPEIEGKRSKEELINKENFFCYLYDKKIEFERAIILRDTILEGAIIPCTSSNCKRKYEFENSINYINFYMSPALAQKILEINPDIIFSIYHLSNAYWYIKDEELKVLALKRINGEIIDFTIYNPEKYLESISEERLNGFLKKIRLVFY